MRHVAQSAFKGGLGGFWKGWDPSKPIKIQKSVAILLPARTYGRFDWFCARLSHHSISASTHDGPSSYLSSKGILRFIILLETRESEDVLLPRPDQNLARDPATTSH